MFKRLDFRVNISKFQIPIFSSQLEKSREAVDAANIRAAYAEVKSEAITNDGKVTSKEVELKQTQSGWQNSFDFPENLTSSSTTNQPGDVKKATISYDADNSEATIDIVLTQKSGN